VLVTSQTDRDSPGRCRISAGGAALGDPLPEAAGEVTGGAALLRDGGRATDESTALVQPMVNRDSVRAPAATNRLIVEETIVTRPRFLERSAPA
jgi:hypothetical protein